MGSVDVGWDDGGIVATVFLVVASVHHIYHSFGVGVALVRAVWRAVVLYTIETREHGSQAVRVLFHTYHHGLVNRVRRFVGKNAGRQTRNQLGDSKLATAFHHIVID
jgi:hypothetical protein